MYTLMKYPRTPFSDTKVIESRLVANGQAIRRRRQSLSDPSIRFTTYERIERPNLVVVKRSGERQMFDRQKIVDGLHRACQKTAVTADEVEDLVAQIEEALYGLGEAEVKSEYIGEMTMNKLVQLNDVAYVRFASVYKSFGDIESFENELRTMKQRLSATDKT